MKKIISALILTVVLGSLVAPVAVSAQITDVPEECEVSLKTHQNLSECDYAGKCKPGGTDTKDENCGFCCLMSTIYKITDWLFLILMLVVVLMIIWGGFQYVTAGGVPEKAATGKQILTYAIIGLAIALLAKIIPSVVQFIIGVD